MAMVALHRMEKWFAAGFREKQVLGGTRHDNTRPMQQSVVLVP